MELIITNRKGISFDIVYDADDHELITKYNWHIISNGNTQAWIKGTNNPHQYLTMHRLILGVTDPEIDIDHINHNRLDNRKCNLRICTTSENSHNHLPQEGKSSKYKGVSWYEANKTWRIQIGINYTVIGLGYHKDEVEAARIYDRAARIFHQKYGYLNFPDYKDSIGLPKTTIKYLNKHPEVANKIGFNSRSTLQ